MDIINADNYNPEYHYIKPKVRPTKDGDKTYIEYRARTRLRAAPMRDLLMRKRRYFTSLAELANHLGLTERTVNRIIYNECDTTHINNADRICMGFNTTLREVYGE